MKCNTEGYFSALVEGKDRNGNQYCKIYIVDLDNRTYSFKVDNECVVPQGLKMGSPVKLDLNFYDFNSPDGKRIFGFKCVKIII